jgi:hypothetical protein
MGSSVEEISEPEPTPAPLAAPPEPATDAEAGLADAVRRALAAGAPEGDVIAALEEGGCPSVGAREIVATVRAAAPPATKAAPPCGPDAELAERYARRILYGFLWAAGGVVVTVVSYGAASSGGRYFLAYGAILYGVLAMLSGAVGWSKHR